MMYKDMERADFVDLMLSDDEGDTLKADYWLTKIRFDEIREKMDKEMSDNGKVSELLSKHYLAVKLYREELLTVIERLGGNIEEIPGRKIISDWRGNYYISVKG